MNLIITAGGTRERIDAVRAITNDATGRLGSLIAEEFSRRLQEKNHHIYYLCGYGAVTPAIPKDNIQIIRIEGTDQLLSEMEHLLTARRIDAVIHSMAVSDYKVGSIATLENIARATYEKIQDNLSFASWEEWQETILEAIKEQALKEQKISSYLENPLLLLEKTPKVIGRIKQISPKTVLVGFKLLSGVSKDKLIETAYELLQKNSCDYVLANAAETIKDGQHIGYLIDKDRKYKTFTSKEQIAAGIADSLL